MNDKYHGMTIVTPTEQIAPRGKYVLETASSGIVVLRHYNEDLYEDMDPIEVDILRGVKKNGKMSAANCTGAIKRQLGMHSMLISTYVIDMIEELVNA